MESKDCDQSRKRMEDIQGSGMAFEDLGESPQEEKWGGERAFGPEPYWFGWRRWSMEWDRRCWIMQAKTL